MFEKVKLIECLTTWQGEGPDTGKRMLLCRFKYCNKRCTWCDTLVKMRAQQEAEFSIEQLQAILTKENCGLMITGGEPTITKHFNSARDMLFQLHYPFANVETNGCRLLDLMKITPKEKPVTFVYSPKIFSEADFDEACNLSQKVLDDKRVVIKLVYEKRDDDMIEDYMKFLKDNFDTNRVYLMPEGTTRVDLLRNSSETFDKAEKYMFGFSSRQHVIYEFI